LLSIFYHLLRDQAAAEDLVQEVFLRIYRARNGYQPTAKFSTWLFRITVNQALMKLRKRRTTKDVSLDDFHAAEDILPCEVADWAPNPEELYRTSELRDILLETLGELRPILRTVFVLRDIEELTVDQTAEVLAITSAAVKARLWRARLQLRELLSEYFSKHKECRDQPGHGQRTERVDGLSFSHRLSGLGYARSQLITPQLHNRQ